MTAFLDTNVLIYAQGAEPKSEVARQAILAGGVISVQVLNEFAAVLRRKFRFEWDVIIEAVTEAAHCARPRSPESIYLQKIIPVSRPLRLLFTVALIQCDERY